MKFLNYLMIFTLCFFGCSITKETVDVKLAEMNPKVISTLTIADLKVKEQRVSTTVSGQKKAQQNIDLFIKNKKIKALNQLQIKCQADALVETRYEVKLEKNNNINVKVSAYPAYYYNFRSISKETPESLKNLFSTEIVPMKTKILDVK